MMEMEQWRNELASIVEQCRKQLKIEPGNILVVGCSTSEVAGKRIGTAGSFDIAAMIFEQLQAFAREKNLRLAFQCCEHLNRALVVERETAEKCGLEEVTVVPVREAGGAMAAYAYSRFENPVVAEFIQADAGIDIGDTFIGMHLKHVAVPVRIEQKSLGHAHVTIAATRPKLIGGERAVYNREKLNIQCSS
jgi:uncharacterized protein (TIGR01440 family)